MLVIAAKATSWWEKFTLAIRSLVWVVIEDVLISIFITLSWRTSEPYTEWDLHKAQEWQFAMEKSLLFILGTLSTCYIFVRAHTHISHEPARASPAPSLAAAPSENDDIFLTNPIPSRKGYKDMLYEEAQGWPNTLLDTRLKRLIRYDEDDERLPVTGLPDTRKQQLVYEAFARMQAHMDNTKPFRVYGTPALFPLDRLRCWVLTNNHRERSTPFPPNYVPIGPGGDEAMAVSSVGMDSNSEHI